LAYKVIISATAMKQVAKLDKAIQKRIVLFLSELGESDNPRIYGLAMQGTEHLWRYRVGDYRIIANIEDKTITITILKVGHRREVYR
jgi:mRNA interferase RelE/StbE